MSIGVPLLSLGIFAALIVLGIWLFVRATRANEMRQEALKTKTMHVQPWGNDRDRDRSVR